MAAIRKAAREPITIRVKKTSSREITKNKINPINGRIGKASLPRMEKMVNISINSFQYSNP
jgi:hypothetical protein